jgi:hypothetical protein
MTRDTLTGKGKVTMGEVAVRANGKPVLTGKAKVPATINKIIDFEGWAQAIAYGEPYKEPDPEFITRMLAMRSILATSVEEAFSGLGIVKVQEWILDRPGETSGPIEINDIYVAESDFESGNGCFVIITCVNLMDGTEIRASTGATNIQASLIGLLQLGNFPVKCQIKRGDSKDKGGRYLLHLLPPD